MPYERAAEFEERTGAAVLQFYGSNETGALSRTTTRDTREKRLRTAGRLIDAMDVHLFDDAGPGRHGERQWPAGLPRPAREPRLLGRRGGERQAVHEGRLPAHRRHLHADTRANLSVVGRTADFIIRGGKNISGPAVEDAVSSHPAVALAAAVAMPDPVFGERVCAYVELRPGETLDLDRLVAHLEAKGVTREWFPEKLVVLDALPRASGGKVAKGALREDVRRRLAEER